jgi:hypothetical protein
LSPSFDLSAFSYELFSLRRQPCAVSLSPLAYQL